MTEKELYQKIDDYLEKYGLEDFERKVVKQVLLGQTADEIRVKLRICASAISKATSSALKSLGFKSKDKLISSFYLNVLSLGELCSHGEDKVKHEIVKKRTANSNRVANYYVDKYSPLIPTLPVGAKND